MRIRRLIALCAVLMLAPVGARASTWQANYSTRFTLFSWTWLRAPFAWLAHSEPAPQPPCTGPACFPLGGTRGFQVISLDQADHGVGLYVQLDGSVQFRSAEITFADGEVDRLDLQYAIRTDGIFELRDFGRERDVLSVLLVVRAASPDANLRIRFGQPVE